MNEESAPTVAELRAADAEARRVAQSVFDQHVVLEAGAGTGKTSCLVHRIVAWCLGEGFELAQTRRILDGRARDGEEEDEAVAEEVLTRVAAITFTEMAAAELAGRVSRTLEQIQRGEQVVGFDLSVLGPLEGSRERARHLQLALDRLQTSTIHAFCRRLLAEHPVAAGLAPGFEVDADFRRLRAASEEVVWEVLHGVVAASNAAEEAALAADVQRLLVAGRSLAELADALFELAKEGVRAESFAGDPCSAAETTELLEVVRRAADELRRCAADRFTAGKGNLRAARRLMDELSLLGTRLHEQSDLDGAVAVLRELPSDAAFERIAEWAKNGTNPTESKALEDAEEDLRQWSRELFPPLATLRSEDPELLRATWRTTHRLLARVEERLRRRGVQTFASLLRDARDLLVENAEVRATLRASFDQLLVDEFQDTDPLQCELVAALALEDRSRSPGPRLFLVGDPKQSIYGFRRADLAAYGRFVRRVVEEGGLFHRLSVNFRSVPAILDEVERLLRPVMREEEDLQPPFQPLVPSLENEGREGFVAAGRRAAEHWWSCPRDATESGSQRTQKPRKEDANELEARAIAADIEELHLREKVPYRDFALLLRTTTQQDVYVQALRRAGVPYVVERDRSYYQRREVIDTSSLVRVLLDPHDLLALVGLLRSPMVGVPDAALLPLWRAGLPDRLVELRDADEEELAEVAALVHSVHAALVAVQSAAAEPSGWNDRLVGAVREIGRCRTAYRECDPETFLERIEESFLPAEIEAARFLGRHRLANVQRFFGKLRESLRETRSPGQVLRELRRAVEDVLEEEEGSPGDENLDAVRLLTIHKSKGLTIPQVYVANLHQGPRKGTNDRETRAGEVEDRVEACVLRSRSRRFARVLERTSEIERVELVRLLYVAATRAEVRLVFAGLRSDTVAPGRTPTTLQQILEQRPVPAMPIDQAVACTPPDREVCVFDEHGVRFRLPPVLSEDAPQGARGERTSPVSLAAIRAEERRCRELRSAAAAHAERAWLELASDHGAFEVESEGGEFSIARAQARWVGDRVHRFLQEFEARTSFAEARRLFLDQSRRSIDRSVVEDPDAALADLDAVLQRFEEGGLGARWKQLLPNVLARELPFLAPPSAHAVGACAGAIDLLVADPQDGSLLVIDYKTDRVGDEADLHRRAERYAPQASTYCTAIRESTAFAGRPVRYELWFLRADRAVGGSAEEGRATAPARPPLREEGGSLDASP